MKLSKLLKVATINLILLPVMVFAHPGHGEESGLPHTLEHVVWLSGAIALAVVLGRALRLAARNTRVKSVKYQKDI